jgi:hypothetical protein
MLRYERADTQAVGAEAGFGSSAWKR